MICRLLSYQLKDPKRRGGIHVVGVLRVDDDGENDQRPRDPINADGLGQKSLSRYEWKVENLAFSPDGTKITFTSWSAEIRLIVTDLDGGNQHHLTKDFMVWEMTWSPDEWQIAFGSLNREIYVVHADGPGGRKLTNNGLIEEGD
jgi:Tol biopolymer transport system component